MANGLFELLIALVPGVPGLLGLTKMILKPNKLTYLTLVAAKFYC